jgi:hypothetical protein
MRASRSVSTRVAALGSAVAIAAAGLVGAAGIVATAGPAGASTPLGSTSCALSTGTQEISASVAASITPSPVNAGNDFNVTGLLLTSNLVSTATTSAAAGATLTVTFAANMLATNATPASQVATFTGSVTLPKPFPIGASAPISLTGSVGAFTAATTGTSTVVSLDPSGQLTAILGAVNITGKCTGGPPVAIASAPIIPAAGTITTVIPNAGVSGGGTTVKLVGKNFAGATAVDFVTVDNTQNPPVTTSTPATNVRVLSPTVIECTSPALPGFTPGGGNTQDLANITVTTAAGPSKIQPLDQFTYVDPSLGAIVTGVTPNVGPAAGGTPVTITGVGFNDVADGGGAAFGVNFGEVSQPNFTVVSDNVITTTAPPGAGIVNVTVIGFDESTPSPISMADRYNYNPGYMLTGSDGGIFSFGQVPGNAGYFGSAGNIHLNKPIVGMALTPDGGGYWLVASDGGVFSYGDAFFYGSAGNIHLNKPVVGIAATKDGAGYWLVASDGGVFNYGDAMFHGSAGALPLVSPVVGMASTGSQDAGGYWLVAADGGVFAYGDAPFAGSAGGLPLAAPVVGMTPNPAGSGYWLVGSDGGVFAYGSALFHGTLHGTALAAPVSAIEATGNGAGYWMATGSGGVFNFGNAAFSGDLAGIRLNGPIVGFAAVQGQAAFA